MGGGMRRPDEAIVARRIPSTIIAAALFELESWSQRA